MQIQAGKRVKTVRDEATVMVGVGWMAGGWGRGSAPLSSCICQVWMGAGSLGGSASNRFSCGEQGWEAS